MSLSLDLIREVAIEHIFISYASEDGELAEWLALKLTNEGYKVWCDRIKLLGGESYPRDIDKALKTQTFRMLALISKYSLTKANPLKERTLGHNISRQRKIDFVIPILLDDTRPDELDWMDSDLTYVPFNASWAIGLLQLIKKLQSIDTPHPLPNGLKIVGDWVSQQSSLSANQERLWTNLFEINFLPEFLYKITIPNGFTVADPDWIFHRQTEHVLWSFEVPDSNLDYVAVKWNDTRHVPYGIPPLDIATILVKAHVRRQCLQRKAQETPDRDIYLSKMTAPDGWLRFTDYRGKQSRVLATGERTVASTGGTRVHYLYHLEPVFRALLRKYGAPVLELQVRLYLTDMGNTPLPPAIMNRRRKRITRSWWNSQWLSRIFAIGNWAFDGKSVCNLAAGRGYELSVTAVPLSVTAPVGIDEQSLKVPETSEEESQVVEDELNDYELDEELP